MSSSDDFLLFEEFKKKFHSETYCNVLLYVDIFQKRFDGLRWVFLIIASTLPVTFLDCEYFELTCLVWLLLRQQDILGFRFSR